jgi:cytoskeletal protein RodZ
MTPSAGSSYALPGAGPSARTRSKAPPDPRRVAGERLRVRRRRVTMIRRRVLITALVLFVAIWGVIFLQLISGHDPALSKKAATAGTSSASGATSVSATSGGSGASTSSSNSGSSGGTSALTTSQS